jgi:hypothetical protein
LRKQILYGGGIAPDCRHFLTFLLSFCKSIALSVIVGYDEKNEVDASERSAKH